MKLRTHHWAHGIPNTWYCLDDDSYDGAPDAGGVARLLGYGATEAEAIANWKELWAQAHGAADWEEWIDGQEMAREKFIADIQEALDTEFGE